MFAHDMDFSVAVIANMQLDGYTTLELQQVTTVFLNKSCNTSMWRETKHPNFSAVICKK